MGGIFFGILDEASVGDHSAYTQALLGTFYYTIGSFLLLAGTAFYMRINADQDISNEAEILVD